MAFKHFESGRSMVEMLGVLAIIGVLSIGGIMGYSYGMDKYRANETINDVNLRAMDLISQLSHGTPTLASWEEISTAGYPISLHTDESTTNHYIKVEKVPFRVCDIIADTMPESVVIEVNNDTEQCTDGENVMYFAYAGFDEEIENDGEKCGDTVCGTCQKCENESCVTVSDYEQRCTVDSQTGWCVSGTCEPDTICNCSENQYCADTNESAIKPTFSEKCSDIEFDSYTFNEVTYYVLNGDVSWWDAQAACSKKEMNLLNINDLVENWDGEDGTFEKTSLGEFFNSKSFIRNKGIWTTSKGVPYKGIDVYMTFFSDYGDAYGDYRNTDNKLAICY